MEHHTIAALDCCPVVYVAWKPASSRTFHCFDDVAGAPLIRGVVDRLAKGLSCPVTVVHHADGRGAALAGVLAGSSARLFETFAATMPGALEALVLGRSHLRHLAVFVENAPFPDCVTARRMIEAHVERGADCTVAPGHPPGLLPIIVKASAIRALMPPEERSWPVSFARVLQILAADATSAGEAPQAAPKVSIFLDRELAACELAHTLLVTDCRSREAAAAVAQTEAAHLDARPARRFKQALTAAFDRRLLITPDLAAPIGTSPRVLFSSFRDGITGAEESLLMLMRSLPREHYEPLALVQTECLLAERLRALGIGVQVADFPMTELDPQGLQFCRDLLDAYGVDVVHLDVWLNPPLMIAAHERGIPIVGHVRLIVPPSWCPPELVRFFDRTIAISKYVAESLAKALPVSGRVVQIYNGIDLALFDPSRHDRSVLRAAAGIDPGQAVVTMTSRIQEVKRQHLLISAIGRLRETHPQVVALIAGEPDGRDPRYAVWLRQLVSDLHLDQRVRFWGFEANVLPLYAISDVVVMGNPHEPWGRSTVEAMAMGVPVVVPGAGGALELVDNGQEGLVFEPDNVDDLARCLRTILDNRVLASRMGVAGRARAHRYSIDVHVSAVVALYRELLAARDHSIPATAGIAGIG